MIKLKKKMMTKKKRVETYVGWTEPNWSMKWERVLHADWETLRVHEIITKTKKAYPMRKKPVKICITIKER